MKPYVVRQGDHLRALAFRLGFDATEIWEDAKNEALKARRQSMDILCPGDVLYIPDTPPKTAKISEGQENDFTARIPTVDVTLLLKDKKKSFSNCRYKVVGLGSDAEGTTDGEGRLTLTVPVNTEEVILEFAERQERFRALLGHLDPLAETSGVRARLSHLGYFHALAESDAEDLAYSHAIRLFQIDQHLPVTGLVDKATEEALLKAHGS